MAFRTNLAQLALARGLPSQQAIASFCGVNQTTVSRWLRGAETPPPLAAARVAKLFGVSVDALFASALPPDSTGSFAGRAALAAVRQAHGLAVRMAMHGESQRSLAAALGVSHRAVGGWLKGATPRRTAALLLARHFGVPVSALFAPCNRHTGELVESTAARDFPHIVWPRRLRTAEAELARLNREASELAVVVRALRRRVRALRRKTGRAG